MEIKLFEKSDLQFIPHLQPADWYNIKPIHEFYVNNIFCTTIKVVEGNNIIGIGTQIIHDDVAWLGHIIVMPEFRNRGIGKLITQNLIDNIRLKNIETIYLIATEMGETVYKKIGFETETEYLFFKDIKQNSVTEMSGNIRVFKQEYVNQIIDIDKQVSGANRLIEIENHLQNAIIFKSNNIVEGYYLPTVGDGLIIATNSIAGIELMKYRLQKINNACMPIDNIAATKFLSDNGNIAFKKAPRMVLGKKRNWQANNIYNRVAGNLG